MPIDVSDSDRLSIVRILRLPIRAVALRKFLSRVQIRKSELLFVHLDLGRELLAKCVFVPDPLRAKVHSSVERAAARLRACLNASFGEGYTTSYEERGL